MEQLVARWAHIRQPCSAEALREGDDGGRRFSSREVSREEIE